MKHFLSAAACALVAFAIYFPWVIPGEIMTRSDNFWYVPTAWSLLDDGNIELSEFRADLDALVPENPFLGEYLNPETDYRIYQLSNDGLVNHYTIGNAIAAVPLLPIASYPYRSVENRVWKNLLVTPLLAKLFAALSVGVFFLVARNLADSTRIALLATAIFAFASPHFSAHAGGYWSHNTGAFFLLVGLWILSAEHGKLAWLSALPLTLSLVVRPDMIIAVGLITLFMLLQYREQFLRFAILGALGGVAYLAHCQLVYGEWIQPYQGPVNEVSLSLAQLWQGILGLSFSPSRGLFVFVPVFIFSLIGFGVTWAQPSDRRGLLLLVGGIALLHLLFNGLWPVWWAGWSYGPRLFAGVAGL